MHYQRMRLRGDLGELPPTLEQRFWAKVDKSGPLIPGHSKLDLDHGRHLQPGERRGRRHHL
jgi:hypothetical protein